MFKYLIPLLLFPIYLTSCSKKQKTESESTSSRENSKPSISDTSDIKDPKADTPETEKSNDPNYKHLAPLIGSGSSLPSSVTPDVVVNVQKRIEKEFFGLTKGDPRISPIFKKMWSQSWIPAFDSPLKNNANDKITIGVLLPSELSDFRKTSKEFSGKIQKCNLELFTNEAELEAAYLLLALSVGDAQEGASNLIQQVAKRANQLPPSQGDVILCNIVIQALRDMKQGGANAVSFAELLPMAESKNPIYRLIALEASHQAITEQTRFASRYESR